MQERERRGDYLGKSATFSFISYEDFLLTFDTAVQIVPHLTDAIQDWIERVAVIPVDNSGLPPDVCISRLLRSFVGTFILTFL